MSLAADGQDGNGLQLEIFRPNFSTCFRAYSKKKDVNSRGLFFPCELRLYQCKYYLARSLWDQDDFAFPLELHFGHSNKEIKPEIM